MGDTIQSLRKQLAEAEENLLLIQERKSEYVKITDVPLQLIKDERHLEAEIPKLRARLTELAQAQLDADMDQLRARRDEDDQARREMRERQRVVNLRPLDVTDTFRDRVRETQELCEHLADSERLFFSLRHGRPESYCAPSRSNKPNPRMSLSSRRRLWILMEGVYSCNSR